MRKHCLSLCHQSPILGAYHQRVKSIPHNEGGRKSCSVSTYELNIFTKGIETGLDLICAMFHGTNIREISKYLNNPLLRNAPIALQQGVPNYPGILKYFKSKRLV